MGGSNDQLAGLATEIRAKWGEVDKLEGKVFDKRIEVGRLLVDARPQVEQAGLGWEAWCKEHVWGRSQRDIRRCMALGGAPDPQAAREAEKATRRASDQRRAERTRSCPVLDTAAPAPQPEVCRTVANLPLGATDPAPTAQLGVPPSPVAITADDIVAWFAAATAEKQADVSRALVQNLRPHWRYNTERKRSERKRWPILCDLWARLPENEQVEFVEWATASDEDDGEAAP